MPCKPTVTVSIKAEDSPLPSPPRATPSLGIAVPLYLRPLWALTYSVPTTCFSCRVWSSISAPESSFSPLSLGQSARSTMRSEGSMFQPSTTLVPRSVTPVIHQIICVLQVAQVNHRGVLECRATAKAWHPKPEGTLGFLSGCASKEYKRG